MPSSFPSPERIIQELNDLQSFIKPNETHSRRGEVEAADWLVEFAKKWELGDVKMHPMPRTGRFEPYIQKEGELYNVTIDTGAGRDEILFLHGHFDVVPPTDYENESIVFRQDETRKHIYRGLGCYDMLSGVASILTAMHNIKIAAYRRVRAVLVFGEENDSEGTHSAFDPRHNLFDFDGAKAALSTEITVGANLQDPYHLVVGRPGRIALRAKIFGEVKHMGDIGDDDLDKQAYERAGKVKHALPRMKLDPHPHDTRGIMRSGRIRVHEYGSGKQPSLSSVGHEVIDFNVHYTHPDQGIGKILPMLRSEIAQILGDDDFELDQIDRRLPWTEPWLEELDDPANPLPNKVHAIADMVTSAIREEPTVAFRVGNGVADEGIMAKHNIPVICVPPRGEGAHKSNEAVDIRSILQFQVPIIRATAALDSRLTVE